MDNKEVACVHCSYSSKKSLKYNGQFPVKWVIRDKTGDLTGKFPGNVIGSMENSKHEMACRTNGEKCPLKHLPDKCIIKKLYTRRFHKTRYRAGREPQRISGGFIYKEVGE